MIATREWVTRALATIPRGGAAGLEFTGVTTDSRSVKRGDLFVGIGGPRFDGNKFADAARDAGACGAIVARGCAGAPSDDFAWFEVEETVRALGQLAMAWRGMFDARVVAITGSTGKTTTKEMVASIAATKWRTLATEGNLNNWIGVPLTLMRLGPSHEVAAIELAMSAPGEIAWLTEITRPSVGVVTNVGPVHLAGFESIEAIARAKAELYAGLPKGSIAVVNSDEPLLVAEAGKANVEQHTFGKSPHATTRLVKILDADQHGTRANVEVDGVAMVVDVPIPGAHNVMNALAAMAAGRALGAEPAAMAAAIRRTRVPGGRMRIVHTPSAHVIDDTYNANPTSMVAALEALMTIAKSARAFAIVGEMLELGPRAASLHDEVGVAAARVGVTAVFACGAFAGDVVGGARRSGLPNARAFDDVDELVAAVRASVTPDDWVLVKGSRGARMERVVAALAEGGA